MHKWKMPGTEKCQNYKEGDGIRNEEYAGYYCLVLAIVCGLNAAEAWKIYQYGPDHPLSKKILKHKIRDSSLKKLKKKEQEKMMKKLFLEGYSKNAIAEAFECLPETVTARIKRAEEDMNGTQKYKYSWNDI